MAQKDTVWQTHLHAAETSGSVNDQKFFDEVSGEGGKKRKSIHWIQAVFFVAVCHLSVFLSRKMEKPAQCRAATDEHIPGERNLTVLRRGDGHSAGLSRDTLTIFESKGARALSRTCQAASTCDAGRKWGWFAWGPSVSSLEEQRAFDERLRVSRRSCRQSHKYRRLDVDGSALSH